MLGILHFLAQLLDEEILPLVVAISGRVDSETPISCKSSGVRGVIVEETVCILTFLNSMNNLFYKYTAYLILAFFN
jgi:hypothetical protein